MKNILLITALLLSAAITVFLGSPLLFDKTVDEEFMSPVNKAMMRKKMEEGAKKQRQVMTKMNSITPEEVQAMTEEEQERMESEMMKMASTMPSRVMAELMPRVETGPTLIREGEIMGADGFHEGSGKVKIYKLEDGSHVVRFENLDVTNGPALSVFLSKDPDGRVGNAALNIGKLKGNKGSQNYTVEAGVDISEYQTVVIYCVPFKVQFAYGVLGEEAN